MTLTFLCELIVMQILGESEMLADIPMSHYDKQGKGESNRIVVKAIKGARQVDGPRAHEVETTIEYVAPKRKSPTENEVIMAEIEDRMGTENLKAVLLSGAAVYPAIAAFDWVSFESGDDDARENEDTHRKRTLKFPMLAKKLSTP